VGAFPKGRCRPPPRFLTTPGGVAALLLDGYYTFQNLPRRARRVLGSTAKILGDRGPFFPGRKNHYFCRREQIHGELAVVFAKMLVMAEWRLGKLNGKCEFE